MSPDLQAVLSHLETLVGFDTQNPPRALDGGSPIFEYLSQVLSPAFDIRITDHGLGRVAFHAVRGQPQCLFNAHIDTVPVLAGAQHPPLRMTVDDGRVYGRGACDIKGAAACLLSVAQTSDAPMALLFTTDEEGGEGCCIEQFLAHGGAEPYRYAVIAEPTLCRVEDRHRGYLSVRGRFSGVAGHSSESRSLSENAIHRMSRWCADALAMADHDEQEGRRTCFNIGTVSGGVKSNVIADQARLHWSARLMPGDSNDEFLERMLELDCAEHAEWVVPFTGPPLPSDGRAPFDTALLDAIEGLQPGSGLDFWTEASLFAAAGLPAVVFGPGDIAQAHTVDEWVALDQLESALGIYRRWVESGG